MEPMTIKSIWTEDDYNSMGWHDCPIRAIAFADDSNYDAEQFESELIFDIDYIFQWVPVETNGATYFSFYISPCTLVFERAYDVVLNLSTVGFMPVIPSISNLTLTANEEPLEHNYRRHNVCIEIHNSKPITFQATGFKQYVRKPPVFSERQCLTLAQRGGICFDRIHADQPTE